MTQEPKTDYDSPWKQLLEDDFQQFMEFFFPDAAQHIDWEQPVIFLDKELQQVVRDADLGKRLADKLVQVSLRTGNEVWVLIHVEVQNQPESNFAERMFCYYYRIRDRYSRQVASFAVLGDDQPSWRPQQFTDELFVSGRFPLSHRQASGLPKPVGPVRGQRECVCHCRDGAPQNPRNPS